MQYRCLAVEILEDKDIVGDARKLMLENLTALKEKGMLILLDDFGSGHTTFGDLQNIDISTVKIDKTIDLNQLQNVAGEKLGMVRPERYQMFYVDLEMGDKTENAKNKVSTVARRIRTLATSMALAILTGYTTVYASATDPASAWNSTMETIIPWIQKLGVVAVVYGGIEMGLANANEDSNQKLRAGRFMISGAIVIAVATAVGPMLYS